MPEGSDPFNWDEIDTELFAGRKIQAIKLYRIATNTDLKGAKNAVEARDAELRESSPQRFRPSGCMGVLLLALVPLICMVVHRLCA